MSVYRFRLPVSGVKAVRLSCDLGIDTSLAASSGQEVVEVLTGVNRIFRDGVCSAGCFISLSIYHDSCCSLHCSNIYIKYYCNAPT